MDKKAKILLVDDDAGHRAMLRTVLNASGYRIQEADDGSTAIDMVRREPFDLILLDLRMLKVSGLEALTAIKEYNPAIPIIVMTAYASVETAVETLKSGAYDYLTKPLDMDELRLVIGRALDHDRLRKENLQLKESLSSHFDRQEIIGRSRAMVDLLETVAQVAPSEAIVLISGESGTGKEVVAEALHANSPRKEKPFVKINCAAITETLIESELFGHEKGAFTGAHRKKEGKFRQAHGGSLFLDEISEMSLAMQAKLLRVLQEWKITRVGGEEVIAVDVRLIAATNKNLLEEIEAGRFREDLFYRLNVVTLTIPPLRDRTEDIPLLANHFLKIFSEKNRKELKGFTPRALDLLLRYDWPGNVRELMNVVERGVVLCRGEYLDEEDLPQTLTSQPQAPGETLETTSDGDRPLHEVEQITILKTLEATGGNKSETARRLGITRRTLHQKLKKYGLM
ncbi:MAG: sigma-54 dependent transcriptional regulator [Desulfohalobiaceae bacterium]|nr:sigma-54 dependent transcriptional regulator [Desulfohalobiaceae bacterium]